NVRDLAHMRPRLRGTEGRRDPVRRLDVGDAEYVFRIGIGHIEHEVSAAVGEYRQHAEFLGDRGKRGRVAARNHAGEEIELALEVHGPKLFDIGVGAGGLVGGNSLDLALAEQSALGIDLFRRQHVSLVRGLAEHGRRAGEERHVAGAEGRVWNLAFGRIRGSFDPLRSGHQSGTGETGPADGDAEGAEKLAAIDCAWFIHRHLPEGYCSGDPEETSPPIGVFYYATCSCAMCSEGGHVAARGSTPPTASSQVVSPPRLD